MSETLRPIFARAIAWLVATIVAVLNAKYGIIVPDNTQVALTAAIEASLWGLVYFIIHRFVSIKTNPGDAATPSMAKNEKNEQRAMDTLK